jgi:hypothetical protein
MISCFETANTVSTIARIIDEGKKSKKRATTKKRLTANALAATSKSTHTGDRDGRSQAGSGSGRDLTGRLVCNQHSPPTYCRMALIRLMQGSVADRTILR